MKHPQATEHPQTFSQLAVKPLGHCSVFRTGTDSLGYSSASPLRQKLLLGSVARKADHPVHRNLPALLTSTRRARRADIPSTQAHFPDVWERAPAAEAPKELGSHSSLGLAR